MVNFFSFPLIKQFLLVLGRNYSKYCNQCNYNRFDLIIEHILGNNKSLCYNCRFQAKILKNLIFRWFSLFKIDANVVYKLLTDVSIRKVIKNFFKGIAIFGLRKPFITGAPLAVVWNYTNNCNLKCSHCFTDASFNRKSNNELTTDEAKQVVNILAANDVVTLNFCGGEPLIRKDLFQVINYARNHDIIPSVSTNATLLSKENCNELFNSGVRSITISLDSFSPKNHDRLRNVVGSFDMAINGILNAVEFGKFEEVIINSTLIDYNFNEIPQIYELVKELGATKFYVSRILHTGRGKNYLNHDVNNEIKREVMKFMAKKFIDYVQGKKEIIVLGRGMPYFSRSCFELSNGNVYPLCEILTGYESKYQNLFNGKAANLIKSLNRFFSGCATGLFYCGLNSEGMVLPCAPATGIKLGNILEEGLYEIWTKNPILNQIRQRNKVIGKCSKCVGKEYCGGCRLTAYGLTGNWLGSDLSCPF